MSSMLFLLALSISSSSALPFSDFSGTPQPALIPRGASNSAARPLLVAREPRLPLPIPSPNANEAAPPLALHAGRSYRAPRSIPLPFLHPRSTEEEAGEVDDDLDDVRNCDETNMHDCFVQHEAERAVESGRKGKVPRRRSLPLKRMPSSRAAIAGSRRELREAMPLAAMQNRMISRRR